MRLSQVQEFKPNNTILCVDDDESILDVYKRGLEDKSQKDMEADFLFFNRKMRNKAVLEEDSADMYTKFVQKTSNRFRILPASSGEMAIDIVNNEMREGRRIAAGFFDIRMPGGIDGLKTIKRIKKIDPLILCAVVTAYTDRSIFQIGEIFDQKDEWIYFSKPFAVHELEQAAINLVSSWNRRRREEHHLSIVEKSRYGLYYIIEAILRLSKISRTAMQPLLNGILEQVIGLVGAASGFLFVMGEDDNILFKSGSGEYAYDCRGLIEKTVDNRSFIKESIKDKEITTFGSSYSVPLVIADKVIGIIYLENISGSMNYSMSYTDMLEVSRVQIANIIENSKLYDELKETECMRKELKNKKELENITYKDELTDVYNRRFLMERIEEEFSAAVRFNQSLSCLLIDVDCFKKINSKWGRNAGDSVLIHLARILKKNTRLYDVTGRVRGKQDEEEYIVARYGGDEFILLARQTSLENAKIIAERLRANIEEHNFPTQKKVLKITASIGIATLIDKNYKNYNDFIEQADNALYKAKKTEKTG